jgi:hypothetical protein
LDEAAERISRDLLMQSIINGSYGLAVGVGLYFIGLPYALMWGVLAALLRFIPYIGPWLGAAMPILLSLAVFPGWLHPFLLLGMILIFELISNMIMEPVLYGQTVGVSEVALITAVAFWTWIWGPIGLALAIAPLACFSQAFPTKPIRFVVPYGAGGSINVVTRLVGTKMSEDLGQPVVVDNRGGAAGRIGAEFVARAAPDGYTLMNIFGPDHILSKFAFKSLPYDPVRDFTPIISLAEPELVEGERSLQGFEDAAAHRSLSRGLETPDPD